MYLPYRLSNYHSEKVLNMELMCPVVIKQKLKLKQKHVCYAALSEKKNACYSQQLFAAVLQKSCSEKVRKIDKKTAALECLFK